MHCTFLGWCSNSNSNSSEGLCFAGNQTGPNNGEVCPIWKFENCSGGDIVLCERHKNCSSCVSDSSDQCGWCVSSEKCRNALQSEECPIWKIKTCEDSCTEFSTCRGCTANINCGWCDNQRCVSGNFTGPFYTLCPLSFNHQNCSVACDQYSDCRSCIVDKGCGWCQDPSRCMNESSAKQKSFCQGIYSETNCPSVHFLCESLASCTQCLSFGECAWCPPSGCRSISTSSTGEDTCQYTCDSVSNRRFDAGIIVAIVVGIVLALGIIGFVIWHRIYWKKRHYYERLT